MKQGILGFQYEEEKKRAGMTGLSGLGVYLELMEAMGLKRWVEGRVGLRRGGQGWTDSQVVTALLLLNLAGGESVSDVEVLEKDEGLKRMMGEAEGHGLKRGERRGLERRWRVERRRGFPSEPAVFRYLRGFHDEEAEGQREEHKAFIPAENEALRGLWEVNGAMLCWMQRRWPQREATLDMDATLVETQKREALASYQKTKAYQPLTTYGWETESVVHSEFRDGNVPAGYEQLRVMREALRHLPRGVKTVRLRSDTAGYQQELLKYCAEGKDERFGVIEFAVGVDVTAAFKRAVGRVREREWKPVYRGTGKNRVKTEQEWAEVCFVPNWIARRKKGPAYRFIATREPLREPPLPGMEDQMELPFPTMESSNGGWHKVFGIVTNRKIAGDAVVEWYRQRCGKSEQAHSVLKSDLAGGRLPSGLFGSNAAWWAMAVLAFNLNAVMKRLWGEKWIGKRLKAVRFAVIALPGRVVRHARKWIIRLARGHPSYDLLLKTRRRIQALAADPAAA